MAERLCPVCGVKPLQPRWRKCDDCVAGGAERVQRKAVGALEETRTTDAGLKVVFRPRDVVLACGHVVNTKAAVGEPAKCPFHKQMRSVMRVWDGEEIPIVEPIRPARNWKRAVI